MKELLALLVFLAVSGSAIFFSVRRQISTALAAILLLFSLVSGLSIANYDWISRIRWEPADLEPFRNHVAEIRSAAIEDINKDIEDRKRSFDASASKLTEAQEEISPRLAAVEALLESVRKSEENVRAVEKSVKEIGDKTERNWNQVVSLHAASSELALLLTKVLWLQFEANDEFGAERADAAVQKILDGLDEIVNLVIVDPKAREDFVSEVKNSLPPRKQ